jgi:3'-phosphoadenosine 5'-phosphosulfate sulfotransferase (PAPS reductase)/FAD synthetase
MTPDLTSYDLILVNSSAGKDSQAMLDVVVVAAKKAGVLARVHVVHADLGRCEWEGTKELAEEQATHYGLPFHVVRRTQDLLDQVEERGMWPSSTARYCTSDHKRDQVQKLIVQHGQRLGKGARILNCMGLRAEESPARAKRQPFRQNDRASTQSRTVDEWLPIFDWSTEQVWWRILQAGTRHHHAYDLGMGRLSCAFCIFAPVDQLVLSARHNRTLFGEYVRVQNKIGHLFRQNLDLNDLLPMIDGTGPAAPVGQWAM